MGFFRKKNENSEITESCLYCEKAKIDKKSGKIFCEKKKKERKEEDYCSSFVYDLLKRDPKAAPKLRLFEDLGDLEGL